MRWQPIVVVVLLVVVLGVAQAQSVLFCGVKFEVQGMAWKYISSGIGQKVEVHVYLMGSGTHTVKVELVKNIRHWFDEVVASKEKVVSLTYGVNDVTFNFTPESEGIYFVRVYVDGQRVDPWQLFADDRPFVAVSSYYWVGLRMVVNGKEYMPEALAPIKPNDVVVIKGYLYHSVSTPKSRYAEPAVGVTIVGYSVCGDVPPVRVTTDSKGYFEIRTRAPNWCKYGLCGEKGRYMFIRAEVTDAVKPFWVFTCTYECPNGCKLPSEPGIPPTPPESPSGLHQTPGFEVVFAIVGLITTTYLLRRD